MASRPGKMPTTSVRRRISLRWLARLLPVARVHTNTFQGRASAAWAVIEGRRAWSGQSCTCDCN
jgi:hypothetical protein